MNASRLGFMVEGTQGAVRRLAEQDARWYMHAVYSIPSNPKKPQACTEQKFWFYAIGFVVHLRPLLGFRVCRDSCYYFKSSTIVAKY